MTAADAPLLGVAQSLSGQRWYQRPAAPYLAEALAQRLGLPDIVGRLLAARGVDLEAAADFLEPSLRALMPDPDCLADMAAAAARLADAVQAGEDVVIFGDYDVDGATSAALLIRFLRAVGGRARHYIPDRLREGYGPNIPALRQLAGEGARLVVTVDCGIQAFDALAAAADAGLDVIVVDHHKAATALPEAVAVVNPNRLDDGSGLGQLAAVGVAFMLAVATNRLLRGRGHFGTARAEPELLGLLDLVALGTVCDVVPLTGLNRAFVRQGLKVLAARRNPGLKALADVAGMDEAPGTYHAGFLLGPRVNAGGRVGEADLGARLLSLDDDKEVQRIAARLHALNQERRDIEASVLETALARVGDPGDAPIVVTAARGWHAGVIGIVAARLKERFARPVMVIALDDTGIGKGSGRSIQGVDLGAAVIEAQRRGLLLAGGGHAMAAGLTVAEDRVDDLRDCLTELLAAPVARARAQAGLAIDGVLTARGATPDLVEAIEQAGPFGVGNPSPRFAFARVHVVKADIVGHDHVRAIMAHGDGGRLTGIFFRAADTGAGQALLAPGGRAFHVAGKLKRNDWGMTPRVDVTIDDVANAI
ncbi:MAG: single-stranded-DNA-specific exonuclease RecJ [Sphingomonadales bacterium]